MLAFLLTLVYEEDDEDFVTALFETYKKQMWFKARLLLNDEHLSEDAVQMAFVGVIKNLETVRNLNERTLRFYLLEATKHAAVDIIRKYNKIEDAEKEYNLISSTSTDVFDNFQNRQEIIYIINKLPEKYRTVLSMYLVFGASETEISKELDIKINTVRQQIFRGKKMFREIYDKEHTDPDE